MMPKWLLKQLKDEPLMKAYQNGDMEAFNILYTRHKGALFTFLFRQCASKPSAEDLAHDAWLAVIKQSSNYQPSAKFTTWLYRIAHNRLVDYWRKSSRTNQPLVDQLKKQQLSAAAETGALAAPGSASDNAIFDQLVAKLEQLPESQIETLLLKIEGFSHAEIAEITNCKYETVKSRLRYATNQLKTSLELNT